MGLKHKAIHAMLANPHLAPFELIEAPCQQEDWTLIDHLMVIHKVRESDYVEGNEKTSVLKMAQRLAGYYAEHAGCRCVVLVKDGAGAQKPAVRDARLNRAALPHIDFCKRNLSEIEYEMMKLLVDMDMTNKLFLVTGAKQHFSEETLVEGTSVCNLVLLHQVGWDFGWEGWESEETRFTSTDRPEGLDGVFVATFAEPETEQVSVLCEACLRCNSTEADTLLVELANALKGNVTICTGDSDVVAALTACGREGIILRMDNKSYHENRDMHESSFGELLFAVPKNPPPLEQASSEERFRILCDVSAEDECLLVATRQQHDAFEVLLDEHGGIDFKHNVAKYLCLAGIRGSVYGTFLSRFFETNAWDRLDGLGLIVDKDRRKDAVLHLFGTLPSASDAGPGAADGMSVSKKRKRLSSQGDEEDEGCTSVPSKEGKDLSGLKRLSQAYMKGIVPPGSYGRFMRLKRTGRHFFFRVKREVIHDEKNRMEKLFFMALCGTDYNLVPMGLGIKRLMVGAVTNYRSYALWCRDLKGLLWSAGDPNSSPPAPLDYYSMGMRLADFTKIPSAIRSKYWTEEKCKLMAKTMKYVCELWNLKRPKPGAEYGFSLCDDGVFRFACDVNSRA